MTARLLRVRSWDHPKCSLLSTCSCIPSSVSILTLSMVSILLTLVLLLTVGTDQNLKPQRKTGLQNVVWLIMVSKNVSAYILYFKKIVSTKQH